MTLNFKKLLTILSIFILGVIIVPWVLFGVAPAKALGPPNPPTKGNNNAPTNANTNAPTNNGNLNGTAGGNVNTNVGANFNVNLDSSIGNFWNPFKFDTAPQLLANILRILFVLIGIAAVIVIIIAGFRMVLAQGNEGELTKAKKAITWAIIGLVVSLLSFSIVAIIQRLIQVGT